MPKRSVSAGRSSGGVEFLPSSVIDFPVKPRSGDVITELRIEVRDYAAASAEEYVNFRPDFSFSDIHKFISTRRAARRANEFTRKPTPSRDSARLTVQ